MSEYQNPEGGASLEVKDKPKLVTLAVLHMAQYFPAAFTAVALPFLFRKEGLPLEMFWLLALPGYTRFLKWLMALVVDNYGSSRLGKRKSWIIPCTAIGALSYASRSLPSFFNLPSHYRWDTHFQVLCHGCPGYCC